MPAPTVEQLEQRVVSLKQVIAEQGETTEAAKRRATKKKLRRVQRKRRRFVTLETAKTKAQAAADASKSADSKPGSQPAAKKSKDPKDE